MELVLPQHMVVDLNSRYSGIQTLRGAKFNLQDIQLMLSKFMDENTILAGHGLVRAYFSWQFVCYMISDEPDIIQENDLKALRVSRTEWMCYLAVILMKWSTFQIVHPNIVDTVAVSFIHRLPFIRNTQ